MILIRLLSRGFQRLAHEVVILHTPIANEDRSRVHGNSNLNDGKKKVGIQVTFDNIMDITSAFVEKSTEHSKLEVHFHR